MEESGENDQVVAGSDVKDSSDVDEKPDEEEEEVEGEGEKVKTILSEELKAKYTKIIAEKRKEYREIIADDKKWKRSKKKNGVELFTYRGKFEESAFNCYKCRMSLDLSICESQETYYHYESAPLLENNVEEWKKRDKYVEEYQILEKYEFSEDREYYLIYQLLDPGTSILNKREFVYLNEKKIEENGDIFEIGYPLLEEDNKYLEKKHENYVRGKQIFACSIRKLDDEEKISIDLLLQCHMMGSVPSLLFNMASSSSVLGILARGKKHFENKAKELKKKKKK